MEPDTVVVDGLDHPECVIAGPDGILYAGSEAGEIYRIDVAAGTFEVIASTGGSALGLVRDGSDRLYVCDVGLSAVIRILPAGEIETYSSGTPSRPMRVPNYGAFDDAGNLYISDSGDWGRANGLIFRIQPKGITEVWSENVRAFPNGLALSPDGQCLYIVESLPPAIVRLAFQDDGTASDRQLVLDLPGAVPDGLAFDGAGYLYISCYRPDRIYRLAPDGTIEIFRDDPLGTDLAAPTNLAFAGKGLKNLYVANFGRHHITRINPTFPGLSLRSPLVT